MANYNLVTYLLVLMMLVAVVLVASMASSYGYIDVAEVLTLRTFPLIFRSQSEVEGEQSSDEDRNQEIRGEQARPVEFAGNPVVHLERSGGDKFGPGVE